LLTVAAITWSAMLLGAAFLFPAYGSSAASSSGAQSSGSQTLVQVNGPGVLIPVGVPLVIAALVWAALLYKCSRGGRVGDYVAWTCIAVLGCFCVVSILSIGIFVVPVAMLLARAVLLTPSPQGLA
jgi:hypothetical protein